MSETFAHSVCSLYLYDEFVVTKQLGGAQLSLQLSREYQYIPTVGIEAESLAVQLPNRFYLREASTPQLTLDLIKARNKAEEEGGEQIRGGPRERLREGWKKVRG